ncbi:histone-lysine N-methyltransferase SETDB2 [Clinocottus analis]|uniref:histone-lysine N-methyltransferase SETDB2 n=1 Tax=Clinocottus analis TaxID=304258 RepID=UPI0035BF0A21
MEENPLEPQDVDRAKAFWAEEDVDQVFSGVFEYLDHLKRVLKKNTATDKEFVQGLKLLECLNGAPASQDSVVQVVIGSDELLPAAPPSGREELLPPVSPIQLQYHPHACCKACLPCLPSMPQCTPAFWGQNPLKVPLLCGFKRLSAEDGDDWKVLYKAPCGQSLCDHGDVMRFLLATESYDVLQVDFFTFNPSVQLDPRPPAGPRCPEMDLSRGLEPTPVQLCVGDGGARPPEFRYRKDRWPHGCFLTRGPTLFDVCCDCTDGCDDALRCACAAATKGGRRYSYHRLSESVPSGVYECGPWCGCVRARCQNRLVQRGIRVRLQVFQTDGRGWGVRCRDDLDRGTFVCVFAGVMLQRSQSPAEPSPPKLMRSDLPSDDEVEVVTEWLPPPVLEGRSTVLEPPQPAPVQQPTSPPLHVPVIQRPADANAAPQDREQTVLVGALPDESGDLAPPSDKSGDPAPPPGESGDPAPPPRESGDPAPPSDESDDPAPPPGESGDPALPPERTVVVNGLKRAMDVEDVYFMDASKEGNVSRFLNHSCQPNLFTQNVFCDCHDPGYPLVAFFTSRVVKAGTELTWKYCADSTSKQEVPCLCGSNGCCGQFTVGEKLCDTCEVKGHAGTQ